MPTPYAVISGYTGAAKTTASGFDVYLFDSTAGGAITISVAGYIDRQLIAGGGTGGLNTTGTGNYAGGGGAGGVPAQDYVWVEPGTYNVVVGAGGAAPTAEGTGNNGLDSSALGASATGGGAGAAGNVSVAPTSGGSGGGGSSDSNSSTDVNRIGAAGIVGQGFAGGYGQFSLGASSRRGGGGGGAGAVGETASAGLPGKGGVGKQITITGTPIWVGVGGSSRTAENQANWGGYGCGSYGSNGVVVDAWRTAKPGLGGAVFLRVATPGGTVVDASIVGVAPAIGGATAAANSNAEITSSVAAQGLAVASLEGYAALSVVAPSISGAIASVVGVGQVSALAILLGTASAVVSTAAAAVAVVGAFGGAEAGLTGDGQMQGIASGRGSVDAAIDQSGALRGIATVRGVIAGGVDLSGAMEAVAQFVADLLGIVATPPEVTGVQHELTGVWRHPAIGGVWQRHDLTGAMAQHKLTGTWRRK